MSAHIRITANGRVVIPADVRRRLGVERGGLLVVDEDEFGVRLSTPRQRIAAARALARAIGAGKAAMTVEDYLRDKRAEVTREERAFDGLRH